MTRRTTVVFAMLLVLGAVIALTSYVVVRHPIPARMAIPNPFIICGHRIQLPADAAIVDGLADGGSMIFGIKDAAGKTYGVVCFFDGRTSPTKPVDRFRSLKFSDGIPNFDGAAEPMLAEITDNPEQVRNFLFYRIKDAGFFGSDYQREMALQLYPSLYQRYVLW